MLPLYPPVLPEITTPTQDLAAPPPLPIRQPQNPPPPTPDKSREE